MTWSSRCPPSGVQSCPQQGLLGNLETGLRGRIIIIFIITTVILTIQTDQPTNL